MHFVSGPDFHPLDQPGDDQVLGADVSLVEALCPGKQLIHLSFGGFSVFLLRLHPGLRFFHCRLGGFQFCPVLQEHLIDDAESLKEIEDLKADRDSQKHIIAQGTQTQAETKQRLSEYEQRVDTLQQFYDEAQRKKKRNRLILWGLVLTLAIWGIFAAGAIVILSVLVLIPYSAHFAMNALSWLAKLCGMQNESVISFAGYASGVVSAVPLAVLSWIAKTAWKKIRGNIGGFLTVSSN